MEINPYGREPLCVMQYDPATRRAVHAYYFLGGAPAAVLRAARRGGGDATLRGYYGPRWRALLGMEKGGVASTYSEIAVYAEDTIMDLRLKVSLASGVALYRQHLFYDIGGGTAVPYRVTVDGAPVAVDWRSLSAAAGARQSVAGVAVDPLLEERRDALCVEALDTLVRLSPAPGLRVDRAGFIDLYDVVAPLAGDGRRPPDGLATALRDRYQLDLLYYGGLLRYWPQLSRAACALALTAPERVGAEYPDLDPEPASLEAWLAAEQAVVRRAHQWTPTGRRRIAVTAAALRLPPASARMRADVRNIFDGVACRADAVLAAAVQFSAAGSAGAATVAVKRHTTSYRGPAAAAVAAFVAAAPEVRLQTVVFACTTGDSGSAVGARSLISLAVEEDGTHTAAATWRDDENVDFAAASREIAAAVAPLVADINAMGAAAFPIGGSLSGSMAHLSAVTASAYWLHAVSTAGFRDMKSSLRELERAGVARIQGLQQMGAFAFTFVKGVVGATERGARQHHRCENQYSRLTDEAAAARWLSAHPGRTVRIHHRATDLRVEIEQADSLAEFEMIRRYVFSFLDAAPRAPERGASGDDAAHRLRRLQERDPNLFDLKKYDPGLAVYSVLCQSRRQPHVYNAAEAERAPAARARTFTKYWNFTESEPAYYECPDPEYPHLSLRAGQHPLGYCLPCCKKTRLAPGSRALQTNNECLAPYSGAPARESGPARGTTARHTLTYGKVVPVGRTSELPAELRTLFADAGAMAIEGVAQSTAAIPDAGFAFALERLLGAGSLAELAALAGTLTAYYTLGGGAAGHFAAATDLADALLEAFVARTAALTPFGPGGALADAWPAILTDLARYSRGVEVIRFVHDPDGFTMSTAGPPGVLGDRVALVITGPAGTYPVTHSADAAVASAVRGALQWQAEQKPSGPAFDLEFVQAYVASPGATFRLHAQLIDMHDRCYGVMLRVGDAGPQVYIPVHYSTAGAAAPKLYGPRPDAPLPYALYEKAIAEIDAYGVGRGAAPMQGVEIVRGSEVCGMQYALPTKSGVLAPLCFFHAPRPERPGAAKIKFPYDSREVDAAVVHAARTQQKYASPPARAAEHRNRLYQMFLIEFAAIQQKDRNAPMRAKLRAAILETKFGQPASVAALRQRVFELVSPAGTQDLEMVRSIIARAFAMAPLRAGELAVTALDATAFNFDHRLLATLAALPADETAAAVRKVMMPHLEVGASGPAALPNMIVPCTAVLRTAAAPQCAGARLLVPADRLDDLCSILASDIHNPGKRGLLSSIRAGTIDPLRFIERPDEHLSISAVHI